MKPRVRFAPSPTGMLHVGGVRTALYNWLFARHQGGTFILRIEDTDRERHVEDAVEVITGGLSWLGLNWDEGPFFQSDRSELYRQAADKLEAAGLAYRSAKGAEEKGEALVFRAGAAEVAFSDMVKGEMRKPAEDLVDFVIMRSSGYPTYNFACVVDDMDMGITHVIRGDDHVENTFRQILLYRALGSDMPSYAHLPMIHNESGQKLSKRDGAVAVTDYQEQGYLPEAIVNYLALLGWSPGDDTEFMTVPELVERFDMGRVRRSPSRFDFRKFAWLNSRHVQNTPVEKLAALLGPLVAREGLEVKDEKWFAALVGVQRERISLLSEFVPASTYFFRDDFEYDEKGFRKFIMKDPGREVLRRVVERLGAGEFTEHGVEEMLKQLAEELGVGFGKVAQPVRVAVSGRTATPGIFETLMLVGRERSIERMRRAVEAAGTGASG
ncbi:MAG: glutamate--tRNA ligase [Planctomycetes bacterium]|nr:glutamate--tRNA ligase [Planctomycetota bacterium]